MNSSSLTQLMLCMLIIATAAPVAADEAVSLKDPPSGKIYVYKTDNGVDREIEIHFPDNHDPQAEPVPGIIMFHGGGWGGGNRSQFRALCHYFASRGLVASTVTYQLAKRANIPNDLKGSRKRICIIDAKSAIRWFKAQADELGVDPERIIAGGGSAGGHISLLATNNPGLNDPQDNLDYDTKVSAYLLFNPATTPDDANDAEVDFLQHVKADFPPAIVFFGDKDKKWFDQGWVHVQAKMKSLDIKHPAQLYIAEGQGHGFFNRYPWQGITLIAADRFLSKLGFLEGKPTLKMPKSGESLELRE